MPGLIAPSPSPSPSSITDNSEWAFNLRDSSRFYYDAYLNSDSDSDSDTDESETGSTAQPVANPAFNKPAQSHAQLLKDLDLSSREDTAVYTPNPWTIAKQNAACRETSSVFVSTTASRIGILGRGLQQPVAGDKTHCGPSAHDNVLKKSAQTTLDKAFTVEKQNKNKKVSKSVFLPPSAIPEAAACEFQTDVSSAVSTIPNKESRCFSGQHSNFDGRSTFISSTFVPRADYTPNSYETTTLSSEPKKNSFSNTTSSPFSRTSSGSGERTKPTAKPRIYPTPNINSNLKRKRGGYTVFAPNSDSESDSNWTTLPSQLRKKRFVNRTTTLGERKVLPLSTPAVKSSGRFNLPIPIPISNLNPNSYSSRILSSSTISASSSSSKFGNRDDTAQSELEPASTDLACVAAYDTEVLSCGRRLTLYKPPARDNAISAANSTGMLGGGPVILSVRRAGGRLISGVRH